MQESDVPEAIINFFVKDFHKPHKVGYVYVGSKTEVEFQSFPWSTKIKSDLSAKKINPTDLPRFEVFVKVEEVVENILGNYGYSKELKSPAKKLVEQYAERHHIVFKKPKKKRMGRPRTKVGKKLSNEQKKAQQKIEEEPAEAESKKAEQATKMPADTSPPKIVRVFEINLLDDLTLTEPNGNTITVKRGIHRFAEIRSPLRHEKGVLWWVLYNELPKKFGKSSHVWQQLGYNPLP